MLLRGLARTVRCWWHVWRLRHGIGADIVLARTYEYEWTPWVVALLLKRPLVLEVHTAFYVERQLRGRKNSRLLRLFESLQWQRAERIYVISEVLQSIIAENIVDHSRIIVIPHGVRLDQFRRHRLSRANKPVNIVFVGSFYPWHGMEVLLEAFSIAQARVGDLRLYMIGDGIARSDCEKKTRALGIEDSVEFTGWLRYESVIKYLSVADIGVAPYLKLEPFFFDPVKVVEYMAAGLATVASNQGQICKILEHGETGLLVPPGEVSPLVDALLMLAQDAALRERLGEAARAKIEHNYTWQINAQRLLSLFEEATASYPLSSH